VPVTAVTIQGTTPTRHGLPTRQFAWGLSDARCGIKSATKVVNAFADAKFARKRVMWEVKQGGGIICTTDFRKQVMR